MLTSRVFDVDRWQGLDYQVCKDCVSKVEARGIMVSPAVFDSEVKVQKLLQEREGGKVEVETPVGFIDLLTNDYVIEIKHVIDWKDGIKVLAYAKYFPDKKPRVHIFGDYSESFRQIVEQILTDLEIATTWESNPS